MRESRWTAIGCVVVLAVLLGPPLRPLEGAGAFLRGDVDESGGLSVTDAIRILQFLFSGKADAVRCQDAADADDNGSVTLTDAVFLLSSLFQGGAAPPAPFPGCGADPTEDAIGCEDFDGCTPGFQFFGFDFEGDGVFFVVDRSGTFNNSGALALAMREVVATISAFTAGHEFAVLFASVSVLKFPSNGVPATASEQMKAAGIAFVQSVLGGSGSCDRAALMAALGFAGNSSARVRSICYVSDGGGTCSGDEAAYLMETIETVTEANNGLAHIHSIQVYGPGGINEEYMRALAERNSGTYHKVSW